MDTVEFTASIPHKAGAIAIEGEQNGGGRLTLDISGEDIVPLLRLTTLRGKRLRVTMVALPPSEPAAAEDTDQEKLFDKTPATVSPSGTSSTA